ncbi:hypothetical protein A2572_02525 [Candidatus Collierbacteria bacterium RIFOXYD1_FULL_40_9]|uniref:Uncharacterized protein n=1 Tax=Candidatus Collierbacteria bacterium RIFOXYD1_FULL_40_9 TaxID=1817731 RepID=A0A1F5FPF0_9BACT|nr:MAG: hypothetical protein A2572_02525 [Candidatus Collierbacteria bacterium RIFOXYD1_FULL_40_9]
MEKGRRVKSQHRKTDLKRGQFLFVVIEYRTNNLFGGTLNKTLVLNWATSITVILGLLGYFCSLLWLNSELAAILSILAMVCLLIPQYFYLNNMPLLDNILFTATFWISVAAIVILALLFNGQLFEIDLVNKIICHFTCPR